MQKVVDKGVARRYNKNKLAIPLANLKEILRETKWKQFVILDNLKR